MFAPKLDRDSFSRTINLVTESSKEREREKSRVGEFIMTRINGQLIGVCVDIEGWGRTTDLTSTAPQQMMSTSVTDLG